jgi:hypothetical protein
LGADKLKSYLVGITPQLAPGSLSSHLLFTSTNYMPFDVLTSPAITLKFLGLGTDHYAVYVRVNVQTDCTS